jgi:hypothetical protein
MGRYTERLHAMTPDQRLRVAERAVAVVRGAGARLVAYVVPRPGAALDPAALAELARAELPSYMVPSAFVLVDALPLTPSGKVDRSALPDPFAHQARAGDRDAGGEPQAPLERALAALWSELLAIDAIGLDQDFFADLGGHSLLATRLLAAVRSTTGVHVPVRAFFEAPTVRGLAGTIEALAAGTPAEGAPAIEPISRESRRMRIDPDAVEPP